MSEADILIVEDERSVSELIEKLLTTFGYGVADIVERGEEAIEAATELDPDLVLMDIMLAGEMKGIKAAELIQDITDVPILFLTGCKGDDIIKQAIETGPYSYLVKPFEKEELHSNIELALSKHKVKKDLESSKEKYRSITEDALDESSVGILVLNSEGKVVWMNDTLSDYTGWDQEEILNKKYIGFLKENVSRFVVDDQKYLDRVLNAYDYNQYDLSFEFRCKPKEDRQNIWLEYKSKPINTGKYKDGRVELFYDITAEKTQEKKVSRDQFEFSRNSQRVLVKKTLEPNISNKDISEDLDIHPSTVSTILKKFKDSDIMEEVYLPNLFDISEGYFKMFRAKFKHRFSKDIKNNISQLSMHPGSPLMTVSDFISFVSFGFYSQNDGFDGKKEEDIKEYSKDMIFNFKQMQADINNVDIVRFFEYGPLLDKYYGDDISKKGNVVLKRHEDKTDWSPKSLTDNEKKVFKTLLKNPESSDYNNSEKVDISHPTFSKIRKSLFEKGILQKFISPNLSRIGLSHLMVTHIELGDEEEKGEPYNLLNYLEKYNDNIVFCLIFDQKEIVIMTIFKSPDEKRLYLEKIISYLSSKLISQENLDITEFHLNRKRYSKVLHIDQIMEELF